MLYTGKFALSGGQLARSGRAHRSYPRNRQQRHRNALFANPGVGAAIWPHVAPPFCDRPYEISVVCAPNSIWSITDRFAFGLSKHIVHKELLTPENVAERYGPPSGPGHMLRSWDLRVRTSIPGLMLCGADAEPVGAASGRAGRVAASFVPAEVPR